MPDAPDTKQNNDSLAPKHAKAEGEGQDGTPRKKKRSVVVLSVVLALLVCVAAAGGAYLLWHQQQLDQAARLAEQAQVPEAPQEVQDTRVQNPVDFAELEQQNPDIYAWLYIPNTNVNLPVLQNGTYDNFYLDHNQAGEYSPEGAVYSQMANSTDFTDPVTVLYGHQTSNNTMFTTLHYFENAEFFSQNEHLYIYTPGHILTYRVVSAYQYDDRHILNSFDFSDPAVVQSYFSTVANPDSLLKNVREGVALTAEDKIVQLSTCMSDIDRSNTRYIVTGVLIDDQPTF